ncbi:MAG: TolB family protein [Anaerolineaceae bacterium]
MNNDILHFENELRIAINPPNARVDFVNELGARLLKIYLSRKTKQVKNFRLRPAWVVTISVITLLIAGILLIGPDRVYAEMLKLFGYIPGIGIVDQAQPIRVLAEPVRVTRDGVTVSINQAVLTAENTQIDFGYSGVPLSAYSDKSIGCMEQEYLRLPDGSTLDINAPFPANVNDATFVMPCIFNTLPNTVPTDWEIPISFIPLPEDTTVLPVIELTPDSSGTTPTVDPTSEEDTAFEFNEVIETDDGYILIGWFRPHLAKGEKIQVNSVQYLDANGKNINSIDYPEDIDLSSSGMPFGVGDSQWAIQFKASDIAFPLTVRYTGNVYSRVGQSSSPLEFEFDAGSDPQPGQEWVLNKDFDVAGIAFRLVSIRAGENGYSFQFESDPELDGPDVQIEGYQAIGGGGGPHTRSLAFEEMPKGKLKLLFSDFYPLKETRTWEGKWQPETLPSPQPTVASTSPVCLDAKTYATLPNLPEGLEGWMLLTELDPERSLVLQSMDGEEVKLTIPQASRGSLSPDGTKLAYPGEKSMLILDLITGQTSKLPTSGGYDWSPDGKFIASVNPAAGYGIFVTAIDGSSTRQLTNLGYEAIAGWSSDGSLLYFAVPDASGKGFMLRAINVNTGSSRDLFILEDSSGKAPYAAVSPDGLWVAYRARDNSSLYLKGMDGSPARLLLDRPATAISSIVWEKGSHLLGVSLITPESSDGEIILIQFENCEIYKLPGLHGELDGIFIP